MCYINISKVCSDDYTLEELIMKTRRARVKFTEIQQFNLTLIKRYNLQLQAISVNS